MGKAKRKTNRHWFSGRMWQASIAAVVWVVFVSPLLFPHSSGFSQTHASISDAAVVSTSTREGRLEVFDDAWSTIDRRYYDRAFHGLDWGAQRTTFRSLVAAATSSQELYAILRRMIASLNDPHTRVFAPEEKFDWWRPRFVSIGLSVREIDGLPIVVQVEKGSAPQRAGVRRGDVIESVNGTPSLSLINQRLAGLFVSASSSSRFRAFATMMEGPAETWIEIRWTGKDDKAKSARFERHWQQRELGLRVRRVKGDFAVIEIEAFTKSIATDFARDLAKKIDGARGLVLDLRSNGGGDAEAMADIASAFLGPGLDLGQFMDRSGGSFTISTRSKSLFTSERISQTRLPLVVLTSDRTSSAAEILVAALKASKRATIIGTETCGCVLAIRARHTLPDGGVLDVSELDYQTPAGDRLEGRGIKPDDTVVVERNDLYSGRDQAMESAFRKLTLRRIDHH